MAELLGRDSDRPSEIPLDGLAVAMLYGDGHGQATSEEMARFDAAGIPILVIVIDENNQGDIGDVETGAMTVAGAVRWYDRFNRPARRRPSFYCNRTVFPQLVPALGPNRPADFWIATLDGEVNVPGAVAVQYCGAADSQDPCRTTGHYDESVILDPSWIGDSPMADGFNDTDRATLARLATTTFDGEQSTTYDGQSPVPADWPNFVPNKLNEILAAVKAINPPTAAEVAAEVLKDPGFMAQVQQHNHTVTTSGTSSAGIPTGVSSVSEQTLTIDEGHDQPRFTAWPSTAADTDISRDLLGQVEPPAKDDPEPERQPNLPGQEAVEGEDGEEND